MRAIRVERIVINSAQLHIKVELRGVRLTFLIRFVRVDNLLLPVACTLSAQQLLCGASQTLDVYLPAFTIHLRDEMRARGMEPFHESQVWFLLWSLVSALQQFQPFEIKSGNLTTASVRFDRSGRVKLTNRFTSPKDSLPVTSLRSSTLLHSNFYAPQQLASTRSHNKFQVNPNVAQTYSLGIIMMEICTFIPGQAFYDFSKRLINSKILSRAEQKLRGGNYSKLLTKLIQVMLSDAHMRPLPSHIFTAFKPYEQQIIEFKPFQFDSSLVSSTMSQSFSR